MMTENLLEASLVEAQRGAGSDPRAITSERGPRPGGLPDKFWYEKTGQVRLDALVKSYLELERKLGALGSRDIPPARSTTPSTSRVSC
jgi:hypothetical protein